ncbi:hypothetical protein, secreted [gut metagenome]|uniref:Lipoprotein n=1 Tax=gut metagenome TaxID=749906 RepID=J9BX76_9ZZZZ
MINKLINPILFIMCLFVTACSDDNNGNEPISSFSLDKTYYEVRLGRGSTNIHVTNGSGYISLSIEDEKILNAKYAGGLYADGLRGVIHLYGLQKGSTTLTITDNVTKDVETVEVKVTDCYLSYVIAESNHPLLKANTTLFFINNPAKESYIFARDNLHGTLYERPAMKGSYEFFITPPDSKKQLHDILGLRLTFQTDGEENVTDNNDTATSYDFQIMGNNQIFSVIQAFLGVKWEELFDNAHTKSPAPVDFTMKLTAPNTNYQITGVLSTTSIPEHILD